MTVFIFDLHGSYDNEQIHTRTPESKDQACRESLVDINPHACMKDIPIMSDLNVIFNLFFLYFLYLETLIVLTVLD